MFWCEVLGEKRRGQPRKIYYSQAALVLPGPTDLEVRTRDVSHGGLCVVAGENLPSNLSCTVFFSLPLPGSPALRYRARTRIAYSAYSSDCDGFKVGLQFVAPDHELQAALKAFI